MSDLRSRLQKRQASGLWRKRVVLDGPQQINPIINGKRYLSFSSNDYLGLANHPDIKQSLQKAVDEYGVGSGASHLVTGHHHAHHALEEWIAEFTGRERALVFSSGYMANLGVITALLDKSGFIFQDKFNHASLIDAGLLSGARFSRYLHNDLDSLKKKLSSISREAPTIIATDAVFSMDGDMAPLSQLASMSAAQNVWLMADDAHGFGVLGKTGAGALEELNLSAQQVPILMATLGKAVGVSGAFVAGDHDLIEALIQFARTYIYTTAQPPALAAATLTSLKIIQAAADRRQQLKELIVYFRKNARELNLPLLESLTPIQPLMVGDDVKALALSQYLEDCGIWVTAIRSPTVPPNSARLRITLSASHSYADVDRLLEALSMEIS